MERMWLKVLCYLCLCGVMVTLIYGTITGIRLCLLKGTERPWAYKPGVTYTWLNVCIMGAGFFLIPYVCQKWAASGLRAEQISVFERVLHLVCISECGLGLWVLWGIHCLTPIDLHLKGKNLKSMVRNIFHGYALTLPLVFCTTLLWKPILALLAHLGLPISQEPQWILSLLCEQLPPLYLWFPLFFSIAFLAPFCEEILFRGVLLKKLCQHYSVQKSLIFSSLLFAIIHQNLLAFLPLFALSYLLGWYYIKTDNIYINMCIHGIFNGVNLCLLLAMHVLNLGHYYEV